MEEVISHEPADSYWNCGNQEGMESRADDVESQGGEYKQQTKEKITYGRVGETADGCPIQNSNFGYQTSNTQKSPLTHPPPLRDH